MPYAGLSLHKISSKCGIFAEADANTLVKSGVPVEEIIASLFEAVVYQNLATLTKGNTPMPEVLLLGGPNLFFTGLQEAWRHHLAQAVEGARDRAPRATAIPHRSSRCRRRRSTTPASAASRSARAKRPDVGVYQGRSGSRWWIEEGQHAAEGEGRGEGAGRAGRRARGVRRAVRRAPADASPASSAPAAAAGAGASSAATSAARPPRPWCSRRRRELLFSCYALSKGNPIEDAQALFRQMRGRRIRATSARSR